MFKFKIPLNSTKTQNPEKFPRFWEINQNHPEDQLRIV